MKSRMERYSEGREIPKRTDKNAFLYDEIYVQKHDPNNNVTVIDNVNEIDINKIKEMIGNREDYKKLKQYQSISNKLDDEIEIKTKYNIDEIDSKNYDINEIIARKRSNQGLDFEDEKIRKITDTQYDILRDLNIENHGEFKENQDKLEDLINTIVKEKENAINFTKTNLDFFADLRETDQEKKEEKELEDTTTTVESEKIRVAELEPKQNTFYSSNQLFTKEDFEEENKLEKPKKEKGDLIFKITIGILVILIILVLVFIILIL